MYTDRKLSSTSNILRTTLRNSTTGAGLTGLTSASSGLIISTICDNEATATTYTAGGSTIETITTLGTYATPTATKCRFKEVDSTNHPGLYEIQLADARFAVSSAKILRVTISGATSLLAKDITVQLTSVDFYSAASFITGVNGLAPPSAWNTDIVQSGDAFARIGATGSGLTSLAPSSTALSTATWTSGRATNLDNLDAAVSSRMATFTLPTNFSALLINASGHLTRVTLTDTLTTYTGNTPQTGDSYARIGAAGAGLTALGDTRIAHLDADVSSRMATFTYTAPDNTGIAAIKAKTDNLPSDPADESLIIAATDAIMSRIGAGGAALTSLGDTRIAFLDASILSRMATFTYTAPDNTTITAINAKLPSTTNATLTSLANMITANKFTVSALSNAPTGSGGGGGFTGSSAVTLTFNDADDQAVPSVVFSVVGVGAAGTDGTGSITIGLNDGTYTVRGTPTNGTLWTDYTLVVSGTTAAVITGTAVTPSPAAAPTLCRVYLNNYLVAATYTWEMTATPDSPIGGYPIPMGQTDAAAGAQPYKDFPRRSKGRVRRGNGAWVGFDVPDADTFQVQQSMTSDP